MTGLDFFQLSSIPSNAMTGYYIPSLVLLSYIMAFLASYVALDIAASLRQERLKEIWPLLGGAFAMGAGIFTMHFIGMLAYVMPMQVNYDLWITLLSLIVAIVASGFAFLLIRKQELTTAHLILGGIILGIAIISMHYTGMASMLDVKIRYLPSLFLLSIVIAIAASIIALWAMLQCEKLKDSYHQWFFKVASALIMGVAICGMHYTGMAAAVFLPLHPNPTNEPISFLLSPYKLAILTAYIASLIMIVTLLFNSYRHLILVKLLMGYITIILLTVPLGFISTGIFTTIDESFDKVQSIDELVQLQEKIQLFGKETLFFSFLIIGSIVLFSIVLSIFLALQFSKPIAQLSESAKKVAKGDLTQHVNIISTDEIGLLGKSFNQMVAALAQSKKESEEFMSLAAHDLKHPLSIIMQASSLEEQELQANKIEKLERLNQMIHKASSNMLSLIDQLLTIHKYESFVFQIMLSKVNIAKFAQSIFEFNQLLAKKKGIQFQLHVDTEKENYIFDEEKIAHVINNLISNALKFSHADTTVNLSIKGNQSRLRVEVQDEAGGIPEQEQNKVFTRFAKISVRPTNGESSHGLGLAICQDIIQAHGGVIGFESIPGKGSTFYFELQTRPI